MKNRTYTPRARQFLGEWRAALACFVVAGISGTAFRLAAAGFEPLSGLNLDYVRNAHTHLMLFSWATPPLMILMAQRLAKNFAHKPAQKFREDAFARIIRAAIWIGVLMFVPFLLSGYSNTRIGPVSLPLTIILSSLGMFVWYAYAVEYWRARRQVQTDITWRLWDWANLFLCLSTLGAWARGIFMGLKVTDPRVTGGSIQFFVITFSLGWLVLGVLGEFYRRINAPPGRQTRAGTWLIACGVPLIFLSAQTAELPGWLRGAGHLSALAVGLGLGLHLHIIWQNGGISRRAPSMVALIFVALAMLAAGVPPLLELANGLGLRLVFVHLMLLGVVTLGLLESHPEHSRMRPAWLMPAAIMILLATMLPTTGLWPSTLYGAPAFYLVAAGSCAPWVAAGWYAKASQTRADRR